MFRPNIKNTGDKLKNSIKQRASLLITAPLLWVVGGCANTSPVMEPPPKPTACADLTSLAIAPRAIGLPTTGAVVTSAVVVPAAGTGVLALADYCKVTGDIL